MKVHSAGTKVLKSFASSEVDIRITKLVEELLPLLIGSELYFGTSSYQFVKNLKLPNEERVINILLKTGYIEGNVDDWKLSKSVIKTVVTRLATIGEFRSQLSYSTSETKSSVTTLVKLFRSLLSEVPVQHRGQRVSNSFAFFRRLCKKYDPEFVSQSLTAFFTYTQQGNLDFKLETFESFLRKRNENR